MGGIMEKALGQEKREKDFHLISANKSLGTLSKWLRLQFPHFCKEVFGFTNNFFLLKNSTNLWMHIIHKDYEYIKIHYI